MIQCADIYCHTFVVEGQSKEHAEWNGQLGQHLWQSEFAYSQRQPVWKRHV